jgi:choline-sulfatase
LVAKQSTARLVARLGLFAMLWLLAACGTPNSPTQRSQRALEPPAGAKPFSVLLVTIDTWRWDYIGVSGEKRVETPNLDRLAREGIYEREAVTPCPLTTPAHASILTGLDPVHHKIWDCASYTLPGNIPTLAEAFHSAGYTTAAFLASATVNKRYGLQRGFETYDDVVSRTGKIEAWWADSRDGSEVTGAFQAFLRSQPAQSRLFVWAHYYDAHLPYRPRPGFDGRYPKDPYAAQVAFIDGEVGKLLRSVEGSGREWRVVVVGDHGEGLGDRGEATHGVGLYRSTLHVPLILHPRPQKPLLHPKPWGLIDLTPTIEEWCGLPEKGDADGENLFSSPGKDRALYAVSLLPTLFFSAEPSLGVRQGDRLYLRYSNEELYDLRADPAEERNARTVPGAADKLETLRGLCDREWPAGWLTTAMPSARQPSAEEMRNLQSLGYISGGFPAEAKIQVADIGQLMKDHSAWEMARRRAHESGRADDLLAIYPSLVARYPNSFALHKDFGLYLGRARRFQEAIAQLEKAARIYSKDPAVLENLGALYLMQNRVDAARVVLEECVAIDPNRIGPQKNLGIVYAEHLNQPEKAIPYFKKYLEAGGDDEAEAIKAYIQKAEGGGSGPH